MTRTVRGYVARGECRQSASCYKMGCPNPGCREAHARVVKRNRVTTLLLGRFQHGPVGYDCGCRCEVCARSRSVRYKAETLRLLAQGRS